MIISNIMALLTRIDSERREKWHCHAKSKSHAASLLRNCCLIRFHNWSFRKQAIDWIQWFFCFVRFSFKRINTNYIYPYQFKSQIRENHGKNDPNFKHLCIVWHARASNVRWSTNKQKKKKKLTKFTFLLKILFNFYNLLLDAMEMYRPTTTTHFRTLCSFTQYWPYTIQQLYAWL